jgi:hypothetical protein
MFLMLICHIFFVAVEVIIYENMWTSAIWEVAAMYVNYFALMTFQSFLILVYCILLETLFVMACLNIFTMIG